VKICITSGTYHPEIGGPPTYLFALANELVQQGHRLRVVTYGESGGAYPYRIRRISRRQPIPFRLLKFGRAVLKEARGADLLYVNDYGLPPAAANLLLRKPVVMKIVGDFAWEYAVRHRLIPPDLRIEEFQPRRFGSTVERLRVMQTWYARRADLIITPSRYLAEIVADWGILPSRIRVIYNAPTPEPASGPSDGWTAKLLGTPGGSFVVLTVARLTPWKGVDVLIRAVERARAEVPGLRLLVAGDGPERAHLEQLAAPLGGAVTFLGDLSHPEVLALMRASQVLALGSAYEGLSHVLLEAMEAGLPIVASTAGGNPELIQDGENGLLVPYGDVEKLSNALIRLSSDPQLRAKFGERARRDSESRSWPLLVDATLEVFQEALKSRSLSRS
jgi:glycosyltransferase involved in cell wall biosynthesis